MKRYGVHVYDAMTVDPVKCKSTISVYELSKLMIERGVGSVLVTRGKRLIGIVTEKDILKKVVAKGRSPKRLLVKDIMSRNIISIEPEMDLAYALRLMSDERIRRLPVIKEGSLVGIITLKDILKIQPELIDLITEKIDIREPERKPFSSSGVCQMCGKEGFVFNVDGSLICNTCKEKIYKG